MLFERHGLVFEYVLYIFLYSKRETHIWRLELRNHVLHNRWEPPTFVRGSSGCGILFAEPVLNQVPALIPGVPPILYTNP